jgi:hypothetical protein
MIVCNYASQSAVIKFCIRGHKPRDWRRHLTAAPCSGVEHQSSRRTLRVDMNERRTADTCEKVAPTQRSVVISIHTTELAMLARKCTAPSTIHIIYAVEKITVQTELKQKKISLQFARQTVAYKHLEREETTYNEWYRGRGQEPLAFPV